LSCLWQLKVLVRSRTDTIKAALDENASSLLSTNEGLAEKQAVLFDTDPGNKLGENEAVFSPILKALERLRFP
jgi:hypothetical protein